MSTYAKGRHVDRKAFCTRRRSVLVVALAATAWPNKQPARTTTPSTTAQYGTAGLPASRCHSRCGSPSRACKSL